MKRSQDVDFDALFDSLNTGESRDAPGDDDEVAPDHHDDDWDDDDED